MDICTVHSNCVDGADPTVDICTVHSNCVDGADLTVDICTVPTLLLVIIMRISRVRVTFYPGM
jgi:hypothetical protein